MSARDAQVSAAPVLSCNNSFQPLHNGFLLKSCSIPQKSCFHSQLSPSLLKLASKPPFLSMADETKSHGNLDFSAPLLSTRRAALDLVDPHLSSNDSNENPRGVLVRDISKRVPFSWERAPGMPKDTVCTSDKHTPEEDLPLPPPKLPPARWRPPPKQDSGSGDTDDDDGDDDEDYDDEDEVFSDAMDMFSLSESFEVGDGDVSRFDLEIIEATGDRSPGYIIRRVLPSANGVASTSTSSSSCSSSAASRNNITNTSVRCSKGLNNNKFAHRSIGESYSPPKACGLTLFFPWRTKPMICGLKSPTRRRSRQSQTSAGCFN